MRHLTTLIATCLFAVVSANAFAANHDKPAAAKTNSDPCTLLDWHDIQSLGAKKETQLSSPNWHEEKIDNEIPGSKLYTDLCSASMKTEAGRTAVMLSFDIFKGKATEQQVKDWLENAAKRDAVEGDQDVKKMMVENVQCETGRTELELKNEFGEEQPKYIEYYVACDKQVGTQHVALNVQATEGRKAELLTPEQAKALLDKAVAKMKQTSFNVPDVVAEK